MKPFRLHRPQGRALNSKATEILFGGGAGGGKSHLLRIAAITWAVSYPGLRIGLFRRFYPDLRANHMDGPSGFPVLLAEAVAEGWCEIVKDEIRFWNGSKISLHHCQHEQDRFRYQGAEFHVLLIDEVTHFTEVIYRFLRGRVRLAGLDLPPDAAARFPRIMVSGNPGGIGHSWVKRAWIEDKDGNKLEPGRIYRTSDEEGGMLRQFIPSVLSDNPSMEKTDPGYKKRLMGLGDPQLVRAMLEGDWDVVAGAMFGDIWRKDRHVCQPFAIPVDWPIWRGGDDGYSAPACVVWMTQNPTTKTFYVIGEIYRAGMLAPDFAERTKAVDMALPLWQNGRVINNPTPLRGNFDAAAFADTGQGEIARGHQLNKLGCKWEPVEKWPGSRIHGAQNIHRLLAPNPLDPLGGPGLVFFSRCTKCIEQVPSLPRDPRNAEDVDTTAPDHAYDALRYAIQWKVSRAAGTANITGT